MRLSLSEAGALAFKAARGGGLDWGLAEEAAWAVPWLCARQLDGLGALAASLDAGQKGGPILLLAAATLSDIGIIAPEGVHMDGVAGALLMAPFLTELPGAYQLRWGAAGVQVAGDDVWVEEAGMDHGPTRLSVTPLPDRPDRAPRALTGRAEVAAADRTRLEAFAQNTYAPATETSRRLGAGGADE